MPLIEKRIDPNHPDRLKAQQGQESFGGDVENAENQETGLRHQPGYRPTGNEVEKFIKKDEVISPELQEVRQTINQVAEKSDTVVYKQRVADVLNGNFDLELDKPGSPFAIKQSLMEKAKKNAENSIN